MPVCNQINPKPIFLKSPKDISMYLNRFVEVELGTEIFCIECSAYELDSIKLSDECQYPVDCWIDPCEVADECQLNTPVDCVSNFCGSCNADFYDLEGNLVNCYLNDDCIDLSGLFFGWCDMYLGVGYSDGSCQYMSGCGWIIDGIDYSDAFFESIEECEDVCGMGVDICEDIQYDYDQLHSGDYASCEFDNDCMAVWGDCDVGLGGCHYAVNQDTYADEEVDGLVELWLQEDCMSGVCDCMFLPQAVCNGNICDTAYCIEESPAGCFQTGCEEGYECVVLPDDCTASSCFCDDSLNLYGSWICTEDCGGGKKTKTRKILYPPKRGGVGCPKLTHTIGCNFDPCTNKNFTEATKPDVKGKGGVTHVQIAKTGYVQVQEIEVYDKNGKINLSGGSASSSSSYYWWFAPAKRVMDGNKADYNRWWMSYRKGNSAHTKGGLNQWVRVKSSQSFRRQFFGLYPPLCCCLQSVFIEICSF